jgi:hypothetical protein
MELVAKKNFRFADIDVSQNRRLPARLKVKKTLGKRQKL